MFSLSIWDTASQSLYLVRDVLERNHYIGVILPLILKLFSFVLTCNQYLHYFPFAVRCRSHSLYLILSMDLYPIINPYINLSQVQPGTHLTLRTFLSDPLITRYWSPQEVSVNRMHFNYLSNCSKPPIPFKELDIF